MSKVTITFDTETNELACSIDGDKVENVTSASIYSYCGCSGDERKFSVNISTDDGKIGDKLSKVTSIFSYGSELDKNTTAAYKQKVDKNGTLYATQNKAEQLQMAAAKLLRR